MEKQLVNFQRQYVGARYVPKIATPYQWNPQTVYEPLTIVGNAGSSYTSKKMVPAGTDINNEEYWALTGNLNGGIQQLQTQVNKNASDIQSLEDSTDAQFTELKNELAVIKAGSGLETVFVCDSYGTTVHADKPWPVVCAEKLNLVEGVSYWNFALGGASFGNYQSNLGLNNVLKNGIADWTPAQKAKIKQVVVTASINDGLYFTTNKENIEAGLNATLEEITSSFPNLQTIYIAEVGWTADWTKRRSTLSFYAWLDSYDANFITIPAYTAVCAHKEYMDDADVHFGQLGNTWLGTAAANGIRGGAAVWDPSQVTLSVTVNEVLTPIGIYRQVSNTGGILQAIQSTFTGGLNIDTSVEMGSWTGNLYGCNQADINYNPINFPVTFQNKNAKFGVGVLSLSFRPNGQLWGRLVGVSEGVITTGRVTQLRISGATIPIDFTVN